jgi:hypothetical protein
VIPGFLRSSAIGSRFSGVEIALPPDDLRNLIRCGTEREMARDSGLCLSMVGEMH